MRYSLEKITEHVNDLTERRLWIQNYIDALISSGAVTKEEAGRAIKLGKLKGELSHKINCVKLPETNDLESLIEYFETFFSSEDE